MGSREFQHYYFALVGVNIHPLRPKSLVSDMLNVITGPHHTGLRCVLSLNAPGDIGHMDLQHDRPQHMFHHQLLFLPTLNPPESDRSASTADVSEQHQLDNIAPICV